MTFIYRVWTKYWPPYDTNYGLFLIVLWKNYEKISHSLGLDDLFATSKPNKCEIFHNFFIKRSEIGHILYYMGGQYFVRTLYVIFQILKGIQGADKVWTPHIIQNMAYF